MHTPHRRGGATRRARGGSGVARRLRARERDPYEQATITSNTYHDWMLDRAYLLVPAQAYVQQFLSTFREFPPRMKAASFSIDAAMESMGTARGSK